MPTLQVHIFKHGVSLNSTRYEISTIDITVENVIQDPVIKSLFDILSEETQRIEDMNASLGYKLEDIHKAEDKLSRVPKWILKLFGVK